MAGSLGGSCKVSQKKKKKTFMKKIVKFIAEGKGLKV
jgi:hypothetical protein